MIHAQSPQKMRDVKQICIRVKWKDREIVFKLNIDALFKFTQVANKY